MQVNKCLPKKIINFSQCINQSPNISPNDDGQHLNTSIAACLETCPSAECWPTVYLWLKYDILVLHSKCQPLSAGSYVFLYKVRTFRTSL